MLKADLDVDLLCDRQGAPGSQRSAEQNVFYANPDYVAAPQLAVDS